MSFLYAMRIVFLLRATALSVALIVGPSLLAQGGIRTALYNGDIGRAYADLSYGLGYDHDITERTSLTVLASYFVEGRELELAYRSNYHVADNDQASFYLGPNIALRTGGDLPTGVPIGFHMGVRGGLEGFYADLFGGVRYRLGSKEVTDSERFATDMLPGVTLLFGLQFGLGWE